MRKCTFATSPDILLLNFGLFDIYDFLPLMAIVKTSMKTTACSKWLEFREIAVERAHSGHDPCKQTAKQ